MDYTEDYDNQFRPLQTIEDYDPHYCDTEYGTDTYWDEVLYDKKIQTWRQPPTNNGDNPMIEDNKLSWASIEVSHPNPEFHSSEGIEEFQHDREPQATNSLLDKTARRKGEPAYISLSTNLGPKYKQWMLYSTMDFRKLTVYGLTNTEALSSSSAVPVADL